MEPIHTLVTLLDNKIINQEQMISIMQNSLQIGLLQAVLFELHPTKNEVQCYYEKDENIIAWLKLSYDI